MSANSTDWNPSSISNRILFEDNHLIIINKLPSEIVQGDKTGDSPLSDAVKKYLVWKYNKPGEAFLGTVHRLDRPVSGALVYAKTSKALSRMNQQIKDGELTKVYHAVVAKRPPKDSDVLEQWLIKNEKQNKSYVSNSKTAGAKLAKLKYTLLKSIDNYHLVEIELFTGRHHQIRVQLSDIGCVIKGDLKYGAPRSNKNASISLHARSLSFLHPVSKQSVSILAPYPTGDIWEKFE
ncbi:MAG: RNA pseudouridine synthase [Bacteroidales bacterium]|nr:RNA pseudouridine synthase [Bacteroidales bacterium]